MDDLIQQEQVPQTETPQIPNAAATPAETAKADAEPTLAERVLAHLKKPDAKPAATAENKDAQSPATETPKAPEEQSEEDKAAASLLELTRNARRIQAERKAIAAEKARLETEKQRLEQERTASASKWKPVEEHLAKGDRLAAVKALLGDDTSQNELFWDLVNSLDGSGAQQPKTIDEKTIAAIAEQKARELLQKQRQEEEAKAAESRNARLDSAKDMYIQGVVAEFEAAKDEFKFVRRLGVTSNQIHEYVMSVHATTGAIPEARQALKHFEDAYAKKLAPLLGAAPPAAPAKPITTLSGQLSRDSGGVPGQAPAKVTEADRLALLKQKIASAKK